MTQADAPVLFEASDRIGIVTLNRPDNRNSMTPELLDAFAATIAAVRKRGDLRCLVITGRGSCFSAGADFNAPIQRDAGARAALPHERSYAMYEPFLSVLDVEVPVIAALNGHGVGGGFGLALVADLRVANAGARYGANFARIGLHPGLGISYLLPRLIGVPRALELLLTGRLFSGDEGVAMGLFSRAVPAAEVLPAALELAREIAANAPIAVRTMKRTFYRGLGWDVRGAAFEESFPQALTVATEDFREGMDALLTKRPPDFRDR